MLNMLLAISLVNMDIKTIACLAAVVLGVIVLIKGMNTNPNGGNNNGNSNGSNSNSVSNNSTTTSNTTSTNSNNGNNV